MTVKSAIRPCSSKRSRSTPSSSLPATAGPEDERVGAVGRELVGVAELLERLRHQRQQLRDRLPTDERMKGHGAVEDDVRG